MPGKADRTNPWYLVLRALNFGKSLSVQEEKVLGSDPFACLMYARKVLKGRLPDHLHNRIVLEVWGDEESQEAVQAYLKEFTGNS